MFSPDHTSRSSNSAENFLFIHATSHEIQQQYSRQLEESAHGITNFKHSARSLVDDHAAQIRSVPQHLYLCTHPLELGTLPWHGHGQQIYDSDLQAAIRRALTR